MNADEIAICAYLKGAEGQFVSSTEICRRASSKQRFQEDRGWALPILDRLVEEGCLEIDESRRFRLIPKPKPTRPKPARWLSPHVRKILEKSGKRFDGVLAPEESEEF
jgi:hypothetical protein